MVAKENWREIVSEKNIIVMNIAAGARFTFF